jgi:Ca2+:H+ antiporter
VVVVTFAAVAVLSKYLAEVMDEGIQLLRLPAMLSPLAVALLVLSPKAIEALHAARANDVQRAVNIGLGSAVSTIALTVPVMLAIGFAVGQPITLALTPVQQAIIALTIVMAINNYKDGEVNTMAGMVHFALFTAYVATILAG